VATITLKRATGAPGCPPDTLQPLSIADGLSGENCVQLVSISYPSSGGGKPPSKKAYEVTGQVVPPEEAAPSRP
jgi:hypothetical protein